VLFPASRGARIAYCDVPRTPILSGGGRSFTSVSCSPALAQEQRDVEREKMFQFAVAQYESGHFREAVTPLERLVKEVPDNFDVHELLGLV